MSALPSAIERTGGVDVLRGEVRSGQFGDRLHARVNSLRQQKQGRYADASQAHEKTQEITCKACFRQAALEACTRKLAWRRVVQRRQTGGYQHKARIL